MKIRHKKFSSGSTVGRYGPNSVIWADTHRDWRSTEWSIAGFEPARQALWEHKIVYFDCFGSVNSFLFLFAVDSAFFKSWKQTANNKELSSTARSNSNPVTSAVNPRKPNIFPRFWFSFSFFPGTSMKNHLDQVMSRVLLIHFANYVIFALYKAPRVASVVNQTELYITLVMMLGK